MLRALTSRNDMDAVSVWEFGANPPGSEVFVIFLQDTAGGEKDEEEEDERERARKRE